VLDEHCARIDRDPATIWRSAQALVIPDASGIHVDEATGGPTVIRGTGEQLRELMAAYAEAGVDEFILPDWNAGQGSARRDFFDWFAVEVADIQAVAQP
jgi:hypothetical protein